MTSKPVERRPPPQESLKGKLQKLMDAGEIIPARQVATKPKKIRRKPLNQRPYERY